MIFALALTMGIDARAEVVLEGEAPVRGVELVIGVTGEDGQPRSGETVRVIHRPELAGETELAIGITDGRGRVRWTPTLAGIARIRAGEQDLVIRVEPDERPVGIVVMLGLVLLASVGAFGYGWWGRPGAS